MIVCSKDEIARIPRKGAFDEFGIRVPRSHLAHTIHEAREGGSRLGYPLVIKSQLTVGGRGKAGAIAKCKSEAELKPKFNELLHKEVKENFLVASWLKKWPISKKNCTPVAIPQQEQAMLLANSFR